MPSAFNSVSPLLHLCLDYYTNHCQLLLTDEHVTALFVTLPSSAIEYAVEHWIEQSRDIGAIDRLIRLIGLYGRQLTKLHLSFKIRRFAEWDERVHTTNAALPAALGQGLSGNVLRHLDIYDHPFRYDIGQLSGAIGALRALTFLRLIVDNLDDRILVAVTSACPHLCELHLFGMNFSDWSLSQLLGSTTIHADSPPSTKEQASVGCPLLRRLVFYQDSFGRPKFGPSTVASLLLGLSKLCHLQIPHHVLNEALVGLMSANLATRLHLTSVDVNLASSELYECLQRAAPAIKQFVRRDLLGAERLSDRDIRVDFSHALTHLAPNLRKVNVSLRHEALLVGLKVFAHCAHLSALALTVDSALFDEDEAVARQGEVSLRLLLEQLPELRELELHNFASIDVTSVALCSHLERLQVSNVKWLSCARQPRQGDHFSHLKQLIVCGHCDCRLDELALLTLLSSCHQLEALALGWCAELSDQLMYRILEHNPMLAIERLEFHELSDRFTIEVVRQIVFTRTSPLTLNIFACSAIQLRDMEALIGEIRAKNRNVFVKYYDL